MDSLNSSSQQAKATGSIIRLILLSRKQRSREIKQLASGYTIIKWWHLEIDPSPFDFRAKILKHHSVVTWHSSVTSSLRVTRKTVPATVGCTQPPLPWHVSATTQVFVMPQPRQRNCYILLGQLPRDDRESFCEEITFNYEDFTWQRRLGREGRNRKLTIMSKKW